MHFFYKKSKKSPIKNLLTQFNLILYPYLCKKLIFFIGDFFKTQKMGIKNYKKLYFQKGVKGYWRKREWGREKGEGEGSGQVWAESRGLEERGYKNWHWEFGEIW